MADYETSPTPTCFASMLYIVEYLAVCGNCWLKTSDYIVEKNPNRDLQNRFVYKSPSNIVWLVLERFTLTDKI